MIALPSWVLAAAVHPEVQQLGVSALKRVGDAIMRRFGKAPVPALAEPASDLPRRDEFDDLREAVAALPTRGELAEAIKAMDDLNEARFLSLRRLLLWGLVGQTAIIVALILLT